MTKVTKAQALPDFILHLQFSDGTEATINMADELVGEVAEKVKKEDVFRKVQIDDAGGIYWPTGFDCCPTYLKELASSQ